MKRLDGKTALVFGGTGEIGKEIDIALRDAGARCEVLGSNVLPFGVPGDWHGVMLILTKLRPDIVVFATGTMQGVERVVNHTAMDVNFWPAWYIMYCYQNYFWNLPLDVDVVFIGSSSWEKGSKDYPLYTASKAALMSLFQSMVEHYKEHTQLVRMHMVTLPRVKSKMAEKLRKSDDNRPYLEAKIAAAWVVNACTDTPGSDYDLCIDMQAP